MKANVDGLLLQNNVLVSLCQQKWSIYLHNANLLVQLDHKPLLQLFMGHTDNTNAPIPRHIKVQHIKGIANVLADSV